MWEAQLKHAKLLSIIFLGFIDTCFENEGQVVVNSVLQWIIPKIIIKVSFFFNLINWYLAYLVLKIGEYS